VANNEDSPLERLQSRLTHRFRNPALLQRALTHLSYLQDHPEVAESNQRLEFLGDAVLQLILTQTLFDLFPGDREGVLSKRRSALSKGVFLTRMARELGLGDCLLLGASEDSGGGRQKASALEDAFESLVGALYLDTDFTTTRRIVLSLYGNLPELLSGMEDTENPKGQLQELIQPVLGNNALRYEVIATLGEDHARQFEMGVFLQDRLIGSGTGPSKKAAEEVAARVALETLRSEKFRSGAAGA